MRLYDYIHEEVTRQGHDPETADGACRIAWMWQAWEWARTKQKQYVRTVLLPTAEDIRMIGHLIEPGQNPAHRFRRAEVRVGTRSCPPAAKVEGLMRLLLANLDEKKFILHDPSPDALDFYKAFELIHPFVDGNGRTGKVLLAWLSGWWDDPEFPPHDLFGEWIRNP